MLVSLENLAHTVSIQLFPVYLKINFMSTKKNWWKREGHAKTIMFFLNIILAGLVGFQLGKVRANQNIPIRINLHNQVAQNPAQKELEIVSQSLERQGVIKKETLIKNNQQKCFFVASRRSKKYHRSDCRYAKNIKESNKVCFASAQEAEVKGYSPAQGCLGKNKK